MRTLCLYIIILFLVSCSANRKTADSDHWKIVWSDEFDYNGLPDSSKWDYEVGGQGWGNNELQYYTRSSLSNAEVSEGTLKLHALRQKMENRDFTSARLVTRNKETFQYGKIEIRAKLPAGRGLWPAFWMLGNNVDSVGWPACGEIDIMEHVGFQQDSVFGFVHTQAYNHLLGTQKGTKVHITDPYQSYHLYAVEWTPETMQFLLDDKPYYRIANEHKTTAEWPFDEPCYLLLNIAVGGNLGGKEGIDSTVFPATMVVDYVRAYKPVEK